MGERARAGDFRHKITIQLQNTTRDTSGHPVPSPITFATVWAQITPLMGRELFSAQQVHAETTHKIKIWHLAGVTATMQIAYGSRTFAIESIINPEEVNEILILNCKETK